MESKEARDGNRHTSKLDLLDATLHNTRNADSLELCALFEFGTEENWIC